MFWTVCPPFYAKRSNRSLRSLIFLKDWRDRFALVDLFQDWIDLLIFRSQKMIGSIKKPMIEFPTLTFCNPSCTCLAIPNTHVHCASCTSFGIPPFRCDPCFLFCNASCIHLRFLHLFCNLFCTWASCSTFANPPAHIIPAQHTCFAIPWIWFAMRLAHATIVFVLQFLLHLRFLHIFTLKSVCMTGLYLPGGEWWYKGSPGQGKYVRTLHWL